MPVEPYGMTPGVSQVGQRFQDVGRHERATAPAQTREIAGRHEGLHAATNENVSFDAAFASYSDRGTHVPIAFRCMTLVVQSKLEADSVDREQSVPQQAVDAAHAHRGRATPGTGASAWQRRGLHPLTPGAESMVRLNPGPLGRPLAARASRA